MYFDNPALSCTSRNSELNVSAMDLRAVKYLLVLSLAGI